MWSTRKGLALLLAVFIAAGLSLSAVLASDMALKMSMSSSMDMAGDCAGCPDEGPDGSGVVPCPSVCMAPVLALVPQDTRLLELPFRFRASCLPSTFPCMGGSPHPIHTLLDPANSTNAVSRRVRQTGCALEPPRMRVLRSWQRRKITRARGRSRCTQGVSEINVFQLFPPEFSASRRSLPHRIGGITAMSCDCIGRPRTPDHRWSRSRFNGRKHRSRNRSLGVQRPFPGPLAAASPGRARPHPRR